MYLVVYAVGSVEVEVGCVPSPGSASAVTGVKAIATKRNNTITNFFKLIHLLSKNYQSSFVKIFILDT
jgi:hypothetical protein